MSSTRRSIFAASVAHWACTALGPTSKPKYVAWSATRNSAKASCLWRSVIYGAWGSTVGMKTHLFLRGLRPEAIARSARRLSTSSGCRRWHATTIAMSSAKTKNLALSKTVRVRKRRNNVSDANAKRVPLSGHPCCIPLVVGKLATSCPRKNRSTKQ